MYYSIGLDWTDQCWGSRSQSWSGFLVRLLWQLLLTDLGAGLPGAFEIYNHQHYATCCIHENACLGSDSCYSTDVGGRDGYEGWVVLENAILADLA